MKEDIMQGITKVRAIYKDRARRAKELKADGRSVVGYMCIYPVLEIMTAADLVPYRILRRHERADNQGRYLPAYSSLSLPSQYYGSGIER